MADWLERARREKRQSGCRNENPTALMAVPHPAKSGNFDASNGSIGSTPEAALSKNEEAAIRGWLTRIEETGSEIISGKASYA